YQPDLIGLRNRRNITVFVRTFISSSDESSERYFVYYEAERPIFHFKEMPRSVKLLAGGCRLREYQWGYRAHQPIFDRQDLSGILWLSRRGRYIRLPTRASLSACRFPALRSLRRRGYVCETAP